MLTNLRLVAMRKVGLLMSQLLPSKCRASVLLSVNKHAWGRATTCIVWYVSCQTVWKKNVGVLCVTGVDFGFPSVHSFPGDSTHNMKMKNINWNCLDVIRNTGHGDEGRTTTRLEEEKNPSRLRTHQHSGNRIFCDTEHMAVLCEISVISFPH